MSTGSDSAAFEDVPDNVRLALYREEVRQNLASFQDSITRMWKAIGLLMFMAMAALLSAVTGAVRAGDSKEEVLENRQIGWERGAIDCAIWFADNELRELSPEPPALCVQPEVVAYYPEEMCQMVGHPANCGGG